MVVNKYGMIKAPGFFSPLSPKPFRSRRFAETWLPRASGSHAASRPREAPLKPDPGLGT